jgi:hypothetical protein
MVVNSNARITEGKTDLAFSALKGPMYSETMNGFKSCFGKHFSPIETSNADDTIYHTPAVSDANFERVAFPVAGQMAVSAAAHGYPVVLAYLHMVVHTGGGAGNVSVAPQSGAAADHIVVRPDSPYGLVNDNPTLGSHPFALGVATWAMQTDFQYHAHVTIRLVPTANVYYLQLRCGTNTVGSDAVNERVGFKMTGWTI